MNSIRKGLLALLIFGVNFFTGILYGQCPTFPNASVTGNESVMCEGEMLTISLTGLNIPNGSTVDYYIVQGSENPYVGEGDFIGGVGVNMDIIPDFVWTVPSAFCETYSTGIWYITGILNPPPAGGCPEIFTPYFGFEVSCAEMTLSGGGDICEGNCPAAPNSITFSLTGNSFPFTADIVISSTVFPSFNIDDLDIVDGQELFICLGGFIPSFDPGTNTLTVPVFAVGVTATVQVISITDANGCDVTVNPSSVSLNFIEAPTADAGPDLTICSHEQASMSGMLGGSASVTQWTTSGDGSFDNPQSLTANYTPGLFDIQTGSATLTLIGTDANGACIPAASSMLLTIEQSMIIENVSPITICNTDEAVIMAMITGPVEPGAWETTGDGSFLDPTNPSTIYTPGPDDLSLGTVTLYFFPSDPDICVAINEPLVVNIVDAPEVVVPFVIEVCNDDLVSIDITVSGNFTNISWDAMGDGILDIINNTSVTYVPGPQDILDQYAIVSVIVLSGFAECGQTTYNISININDCDCEAFVTIPPSEPVCADSDVFDLSTLLEEGGPGEWSISGNPGMGEPAIVIGDDFITNNSDPGIYTVTYSLDNPEPGCPISSSEQIEVVSPVVPDAGDNINTCGSVDVIVNGTLSFPLGANITWETLGDGLFGDEMSLSTSYSPGPLDVNKDTVHLVLHAINPGCEAKTDTVLVLFADLPYAVFSDDTFNICNEEDKGSLLDFFSLITDGDMTGIWMNIGGAPVDFSNPSDVNFDGVAEGYYTFIYQTNSAVPPCMEEVYTIVISVEDCLCPLIEVQSLPGGLCNNIKELNLAAFIHAGAPGTWQIINAPPGSNPAFFNGSFLQIEDADQGDYDLRFTFNSAPLDGCPDSAEITVFIQDQPIIEIGNDTTVCGTPDISLHAVIGGSAINGEWKTSGSGSFENNVQLNTFYTPSLADLAAGMVRIIAQTSVSLSFCPDGFDTLFLELITPPFVDWSSLSAVICNDPDSGSVVNFNSFITSGDINGLWTDLDGAMVSLSDPSHIDFAGVASGIYQFSYLTQNAIFPCEDSSYIFTVTVEDCACPPLIINNIDEVICSPAIFDLQTLEINVTDGNWSMASGPAGGLWPVINADQLATANATPGNYMLAYKLTDSIPGCPATKFIPFVLESTPAVTGIEYDCIQTDMTYTVSFATDAGSIAVDFGVISNTLPGEYLISSIPSGQNIVIELFSVSGTCETLYPFPAPDCNCTLTTEDISDTVLVCPGDTFVLIPFLTGAQGLAFSTWISDNKTVMRPTLPLYEAGTWIWMVRDSAGCETRDTFDVALREQIEIDAYSISPSCDGLDNGSIIITDIDGGVGPYTVNLNNAPPFVSQVWPDTLNGIDAGNHTLRVTNADGCETLMHIMIDDGSSGGVELGPDITIPLGDSVYLNAELIDVSAFSFNWSPVNVGTTTQSFWYAPSETGIVHLIVTDSLGCMYEDEILIRVVVEQFFYVPNSFSPNGDQANDLYQVFDSGDDIIRSVEIYDRWGNQVFVQNGNAPFIWDGTIRGTPAMPGVYAVKVIWTDEKGKNKIHVSDLTLIR